MYTKLKNEHVSEIILQRQGQACVGQNGRVGVASRATEKFPGFLGFEYANASTLWMNWERTEFYLYFPIH